MFGRVFMHLARSVRARDLHAIVVALEFVRYANQSIVIVVWLPVDFSAAISAQDPPIFVRFIIHFVWSAIQEWLCNSEVEDIALIQKGELQSAKD